MGSLTFTWIMWTAGAAAVTQMIGGGLNCKYVPDSPSIFPPTHRMLTQPLSYRTQDIFVYCDQLNALEGFAWVEWYVQHDDQNRLSNSDTRINRILVTFLLIVVLIRGITAARRGDGYRGGLVSA